MMDDQGIPHINVDYFEDLTGKVSPDDESSIEAVGEKISKLRKEKGISLEELSKMTGFEFELLQSIEKNEIKPQLGTIIKLSRALDSAFSRLVSDVGSNLYSITRKGEAKPISRSTSKKSKKQLYAYKSLAPEVKGRNMEALVVQLEENPDVEPSVHEGEEFIYVLAGSVELKIGDEKFMLEPGDSVYYLSTTPHLIAGKNGKATILAVIYSK
ncbi:MAG: XRE family transcriptional regulator [Proteobacteria bacterium]|nr:XRE family transcriptional regulator [Pseudomonadota bacterium]